MIGHETLALRALLKKDSCADIDYELSHIDGLSFHVIANGKASSFRPRFTPQQLMNGTARPFTIWEAWERSLAQNFAGYTVTNLMERPA